MNFREMTLLLRFSFLMPYQWIVLENQHLGPGPIKVSSNASKRFRPALVLPDPIGPFDMIRRFIQNTSCLSRCSWSYLLNGDENLYFMHYHIIS